MLLDRFRVKTKTVRSLNTSRRVSRTRFVFEEHRLLEVVTETLSVGYDITEIPSYVKVQQIHFGRIRECNIRHVHLVVRFC